MKISTRCICGASMLVLLMAGRPAYSQAIQYRDSDNVNNVNVSTATPLPVTVSGGGSNAAASATGSAVPANGSYNALNVGGTLRGQTGTNTSGSVYAADTNIVNEADGANATLGAKADSACGTDTGTCSAIALVKRTNQNLSTLNTTASGALPAGPNGIGYLIGATPYGSISTASTNATSIKGSAGTLTSLNPVNTTTTIAYLRLYNLASAPTCSSATGYVATIPVPPAGASGGAGGIAAALGSGGLTFSTGIAYCLTGGGSSTDNTNAVAGVYLLAGYR